MKSLLITLSFTAISFFALAQDYDGMKITYGLTGGTNLTWLSVKAPQSASPSSNFAQPVSIGVNADFQFNDYFSIRPSLIYQGKGDQISGSPAFGRITTTYLLHYLEIPVDVIAHLPLSDEGANLFLGAGPFIAKGLNGNSKIAGGNLDGSDLNNKVSFGSNGDFKSLEFGATSVLGVQFNKGTAVSINIDFGMTNILQKNDLNFGATSAKTGTFYLCLAQSF